MNDDLTIGASLRDTPVWVVIAAVRGQAWRRLVGLAAVLSIATVCGCSQYRMSGIPAGWNGHEDLQSVAEAEPHGTLTLSRNRGDIAFLVDGRLGFTTFDDREVSFRLSPGTHQLEIAHTGYTGNKKLAVAVDVGKTFIVKAFVDGNVLYCKTQERP
jgi:hypothetical protein